MKKILFALSLLISFSAFAENQIDLTTQVKGVLPVANGGINQAAVAITGGTLTIANTSLGAPIQSGSITYSSINGTQIWPKTGSVYDAALVNTANSAYIWKVPTGTNNIVFDGTISGNGTGLTGTAPGLNIGGNAATATTATNASGTGSAAKILHQGTTGVIIIPANSSASIAVGVYAGDILVSFSGAPSLKPVICSYDRTSGTMYAYNSDPTYSATTNIFFTVIGH